MSRTKTKRHGLPKPDDRGRIRPYVGKLASGVKARFTVADQDTAPSEAMRRLDLIRSLYEKQCARSGIDFWNEWTRHVAVRIGAGQPINDTFLGDIDHPQHMAGCVDQLQAWGIPVTITEPGAYGEGLNAHSDQIQAVVQKLVAEEMARQTGIRGAVAGKVSLPVDPLAMAETATFHQAIDAYSSHLKTTGKTDENGNLVARANKCRDRLRYLKQTHKDLPLWRLDLTQLSEIVAHWRNRPRTKRGNRCSKLHAQDMLKELWRFLKWLDSHPGFRWNKPQGFEDIDRKPIPLPQDDNGVAFQTITKETYSPRQLALILQHTNDFGKALIGVCVNCAFGQSEVGQWPTSRILLNTPHPHSEKIGIATSEADSWFAGPRPKNGIYGEHLLWSEVAEAVRPFLDGREVLPVTRSGAWWYRRHSKNPQTEFTNWWTDLIARARERNPDLPYFPFGTLRDILPDIIRNRYSDDVASLALQHGSLGEDQLLKCYANLPFRKLFDATRELRTHFRPMLDAMTASG
jgi:hypothetical protein